MTGIERARILAEQLLAELDEPLSVQIGPEHRTRPPKTDPPHVKYQHDPKFAALVTALYSHLVDGRLSTLDIHQAAVMASSLYYQNHPRPFLFHEETKDG